MPSRRAVLLSSLSLAACVGAPSGAMPFKPALGPHAVGVTNLDLHDAAQGKDIPIRIASPRDLKGAPYPVIVFSPGGGSARDDYVRVGDHWASHGYVVISITHMDARILGFNISTAGAAMQKVTLSRMADMRAVVHNLDELSRRLDLHIDKTRLVAAGHSMGGGTAMVATGLKLKGKSGGGVIEMENPGFKALVLISDPGKNPMMPDEPWMQIALPTFVYTGTNDLGEDSKAGGKSPRGNDAVANPVAAAVPKTYVFVDGVNHYLGGLMCRSDVPGPQDFTGLAALNGTSTAFLDAVMKNDAGAKRFLAEPAAATKVLAAVTDGRARLSTR